MINLDEKVKFISGHVISVVLRVVGYTLFGVILNSFLLASQWEIIFNSGTPILQDTKACFILLGVVVFPVIFFLVGQKQGIQNSLSKLLKDKKYDVTLFLVSKLQEKHPESFEREGKVQMTALKAFEYLTEIMRDLPSFVVKTLRYFVEKANFTGLFVKALKDDEDDKSDTKAERISLAISNMIPADVISPDIKIPLIVLVLNSALFFV